MKLSKEQIKEELDKVLKINTFGWTLDEIIELNEYIEKLKSKLN